MATYAIIDPVLNKIVAVADLDTDAEARAWHETEAAGTGLYLAIMDLAAGEVAESGDPIVVDEEGVATLA
jgi:hypothetical protein